MLIGSHQSDSLNVKIIYHDHELLSYLNIYDISIKDIQVNISISLVE